ncbi:MAG: hypothetical protein LBV06_01950 [Propionibacteriaceae bacterium]|jgi:hypothetical protein|nr:hypothetical protein [Propionibacteriaceae bacterium]
MSNRGRVVTSLLGVVVIATAFACLVAWSVQVQRSQWQASPFGYEITRVATVPADEPWTFAVSNAMGSITANDQTAPLRDYLGVYADPQLTDEVVTVTAETRRGLFTTAVTLRPAKTDVGDWWGGQGFLGDDQAWPAGTYYIVTRRTIFDQPLERPQVMVHTVEPDGRVSSPSFTMAVTDGSPVFTWEATPGAQAYRILRFDSHGSPSASRVAVIGNTTSTSFTVADADMAYQDARQNSEPIDAVNDTFRARTPLGDPCLPEDESVVDSPDARGPLTHTSYAVVAVGSDESTSAPAPQDGKDVMAATPVAVDAEALNLARQGHPVAQLPDQFPVIMGDCQTRAQPVEPRTLVADADHSSASLTYGAADTLLTQVLVSPRGQADQYDAMIQLGDDLGLRELVQAGVMEDLASMPTSDAEIWARGKDPSREAPPSPYTWNGSSAMVTYIAANLFAGKEVIDLSQFTADPAAPLIYDAANEAVLQNPYITDMSPYIGVWHNQLVVNYEQTPAERAEAAERIKARVDQVLPTLIDEGMDDRAKARAINTWVATHAVYDQAALDFSTSGSRTRDEFVEQFPNAWDAEGVLIDGRGVCTSYATAFKALADQAGLNTVTVTGFTDDRSVGHQWIKAYLDGRWQIIDPTWNSNVYEQTGGGTDMFFGLSDAEADRLQFDGFSVDSRIASFDAL